MKTLCILTDGDTVADSRLMSPSELHAADCDAVAASDGVWRWCIADQPGEREWTVVVSSLTVPPTAIKIKAVSPDFICEYLKNVWRCVSIVECDGQEYHH